MSKESSIKVFAEKAMAENLMLFNSYREKIGRMVAVARASIRQANFQNKNVSVDFIRKLY